jgi:hypothetical protein
MTYDPHDDLVPPKKIYLDNLAVVDPAIGPCELWQSILFNTSKLRNALVHADDAGTLTEDQKPPRPVASLDAFVEEPKIARAQAQAAAAEQERRRAANDERKLQAILDSMTRLEERMDDHDRQKRAEQARRERAEKALADAEAAPDPMALCEDRAQPESGEAEEAASPRVYH